MTLDEKHSTRYLKYTHKFGIECLKSVDDAFEVAEQNDCTINAAAITKAMKNVQLALNPLEDCVPTLMNINLLNII